MNSFPSENNSTLRHSMANIVMSIKEAFRLRGSIRGLALVMVLVVGGLITSSRPAQGSRDLFVVASGGAHSGPCSVSDPCTLQAALSSSTSNTLTIVNLNPGTYRGTLVINSPVTIVGSGSTTVLSIVGTEPAVVVKQSVTATLQNLTVSPNGNGSYSLPSNVSYGAGGIDNGGDLTLDNVSVAGFNVTQPEYSPVNGRQLFYVEAAGGIYNAPGATLNIIGGAIQNNSANFSRVCAGGIANDGSLTLTGVTISGNSCGSKTNPAIASYAVGGVVSGGAWLSGIKKLEGVSPGSYATLSIVGSNISDNYSMQRYLDVHNDEFAGGVLDNNLNSTPDTISNSTFSLNQAGKSGGGLFAIGPVVVSGSTFSANSSNGNGGAISGGLMGATNTTLSIVNDTFASNSATLNGGALAFGHSPIANPGNLQNINDALNIVGATFANNFAKGDGSGISVDPENQNHSTIVSVAGTLFDSTSCYIDKTSNWNDLGYNIATDSSCGFDPNSTSKVLSKLALGSLSLANNGGQTQTVAVIPPSPAYDVIPVSSKLCTGGTDLTIGGVTGINIPSTDQVGDP
ncbi:MAG: hypothetical protein M0019_01580, partial [Actinomycetota bacterium]|nr:hypothetical protein [Actinomycetota bacterium]